MNLKVKGIFKDSSLSEITINDFRTISFYFDNGDDDNLYEFLTKEVKHCNCVDKLMAMMTLRKEMVSENIVFSSGDKNITILIQMWIDTLKNNVKSIKTIRNVDNIIFTLDYPRELCHETIEDLMIDCVYHMEFKGKELNISNLSKSEKQDLFDRLSPSIMEEISNFIQENNQPIVLMSPRLGLSEISINFFDNSGFDFLKILFNYYTYENILETVFMLSRRIPDVGYLNSRTPRDIEFLTKLYAEEVAKQTEETKSIV